MVVRSRPTQERCCWARPIARSVWWHGSPAASSMVGHKRRSSTASARWWCSGCSASRSALRTWSITISYATDPVLAALAGKLTARRRDCAPLAGKSTLNRLEHAPARPSRYHKIGHDGAAIEHLLVDLFLEAHTTAPRRIVLDLDATDPLHGHQEGRFFHGSYDCYCYLPLYVFCGRHLVVAKLRRANIDASAGAVTKSHASSVRSASLAAGEDLAPCRLRLCPGRAHGVVRGPPGRLSVRAGPQ